ncbi:MAG: peptidylprolyl isomerase [Acidimicrobiales bacterium]
MPTEKRARQKAARRAKRAAQVRRAKTRKWLRNSGITVIAAAVVIALVFLTLRPGSPKTPKSTAKSTTTTTLGATGTKTAQSNADKLAVDAGCPASTTARVNTLSWTSPPAMTLDTSKSYSATVKTTTGTFTVALDAKTAPNTVNSFVFLAHKSYFHCVIFHRVVKGFVDQTGDPTGTGSGGPGYDIANENVPTQYATGDVAMANSGGTDTNGSQFFVVVPGGATELDGDLKAGGYSLFGKVTKGMGVVEKINSEGSTTPSAKPAVVQRILSVTIHES